ncbi:MAG: hypothetical protein OSA98_01165 [Rubripirellula sp.]|nr:hypothetical protein [Rubripirellula sp.]
MRIEQRELYEQLWADEGLSRTVTPMSRADPEVAIASSNGPT